VASKERGYGGLLMIDTIEIKDSITDAISAFPDVLSNLSKLEISMTSAEIMLAQNLWTGEAKEKCAQIQELLWKYYNSIKGLITQLQPAVITLEKNKVSFPSNSDALASISKKKKKGEKNERKRGLCFKSRVGWRRYPIHANL
jgi:hypothetical protein